jgi:hypothetical protein
MFVIAQHKITDPKGFWEGVKRGMADIPADMKVRQMLPNADGTAAICLWQADSVAKVKALVDGSVGRFSTNTFFEVAEATAVGLPATTR